MIEEEIIKAILKDKQAEAESKLRHYTAHLPENEEEWGDYSFSMGRLDLIHELMREIFKEE